MGLQVHLQDVPNGGLAGFVAASACLHPNRREVLRGIGLSVGLLVPVRMPHPLQVDVVVELGQRRLVVVYTLRFNPNRLRKSSA